MAEPDRPEDGPPPGQPILPDIPPPPGLIPRGAPPHKIAGVAPLGVQIRDIKEDAEEDAKRLLTLGAVLVVAGVGVMPSGAATGGSGAIVGFVIVLVGLSGMEAGLKSTAVANDPPDYWYAEVVRIPEAPASQFAGLLGSFHSELRHFGAIQEGMLVALERLQGAQTRGDPFWEHVHSGTVAALTFEKRRAMWNIRLYTLALSQYLLGRPDIAAPSELGCLPPAATRILNTPVAAAALADVGYATVHELMGRLGSQWVRT